MQHKFRFFRKRKVPEGEQTTPERPKRGPGRPPKEQTPAPEAEAAPQQNAEQPNEVGKLTFGLICFSKGSYQ